MRIGELARRTGMSVHALRFYEARGLLGAGAVTRSANNYRDYPEAAVESLRTILAARAAGFTLAEIAALLKDLAPGRIPPPKKRALLEAKLADIDAKLADLRSIRKVVKAKLDGIE